MSAGRQLWALVRLRWTLVRSPLVRLGLLAAMAVAPVLGAHLAEGMSLGRALAVLTFGLTLVVIVLVGADVPRRLGRLTDPEGDEDHLVPGQPLSMAGPDLKKT